MLSIAWTLNCVFICWSCEHLYKISPLRYYKCAWRTFPFQQPSVAYISNHQLPISEQEQLQKQLFRNEMTIIEAVKNQSPLHQKYPPSSMVEVGDLVYMQYNFCDGSNSEPGTVILLCQLVENVAKFKKMSESSCRNYHT